MQQPEAAKTISTTSDLADTLQQVTAFTLVEMRGVAACCAGYGMVGSSHARYFFNLVSSN